MKQAAIEEVRPKPKGWSSSTATAQRLLGITPDGIIGRETVRAAALVGRQSRAYCDWHGRAWFEGQCEILREEYREQSVKAFQERLAGTGKILV